jgi:hypothetical protein
MSEIQAPKNCGLYLPGHSPHWIQTRKGWEDKVNVPLPGRLLSTSDDGTVVIEVDGEQLRLWNHQPDRFAEAAAQTRGSITYQARWHLLFVGRSSGSRYAFCVAKPSEGHVPCPETPPTGSPVELLKRVGGFTISASELGKVLG